MLDSQTKKRIDDCRDILVGKITDPKSQVEQITIAMIYKFMDDMDLQSEEYGGSRQFFVGDYQKYSWSKIFSPRVDAYEMLNLYGEGIEKMSENPNLNPLFRSIFKDAYLPYRDPETLKLFLKTIDGFSYENSENLGDAYEYLLSVLGSQGGAGQFRTPRHIIDFIVDLVQPKKGDRILDPACGTSGFLISSYKRILKRNTDKKLGDKLSSMEKKHLLNSIYGYDLDPNMVRLSLVNLFLHGFTEDELNVIEYDSLTSEDRWNEYFDVILANPPFMTPKGGIRPHNRFSIKSNRAEVLFVNYIMEHLTPKGRAGIVVPEGIIFQSGTTYKQLRKSLVEKYLIGVVSLPSGVFNPYSGVKTSILILDRELSQKTDKIFFGKVENDGYGLGAQRRQIDKNDLPKIKVGVLEYVQNLTDGIYQEHQNLSYVSKEEIINSSDIGLSFERYKVEDSFNSNFELVKIGDVVEFTNGYAFKSKDLISNIQEGYLPIIKIGNFNMDGKVDLSKVQYHKYEDKYNKYLIKEGDILVAMTGATSGKTAISHLDNLLLNQRVGIIRNRDLVNREYLKYFLFSNVFYDYCQNNSGGGAQGNVSPRKILEFKIPLPPLEIQNEIVEELEQYQKVIDGAKQVVDNYKPHIDIDESWEKIELDEICSLINGKTYKKEEWVSKNEFSYPIIRIQNLTTPEKSSFNYFQGDLTKQVVINKGDLLFSWSGSKNTSFGPHFWYGAKSVLNQHIFKVELKNNKVNKKFLYFLLLDLVEGFLRNLRGGVGLVHLTKTDLKQELLPIPKIEIQNQIVEKLEEERQIVEGNKKLIEIYTQKIEDRINKIWGE